MNIQLTIPRSKMITSAFMLFFLSIFLTCSTAALADVWDKWDSHTEEYKENEGVEDYVWKEGGNKMPEYPENSDLLEVAGPPAYRNYQYFIDAKNLTVGADGVVRYSIVIRSSSGADNAMYDGIRCTTNQMKNYAYGSTGMDGNKKFIQKTSVAWTPFRTIGATGYAPILAMNYFCDHSGVPLKRHVIIQNIKYGKGPVDGLYN
ncbi:MAG: CNP1-like family protein [gamma proteobacterium symbiont of Bathyaustriella thionipta]|nr:CNP1-like family protein [gamma proteobacterium symbiont of Bathyaustriella thionipta]MCU7948637.1 CNP1-like family protein [gamma proteobacterium symbiont of Bathyaustriella thionipta]MCU7953043.1 CNP1-like family protein [gamma proteobacterium symbiont of Bathyaustriella thionipta]MCU7955357.1 CNP1-like family protein [gamma proteobacterium symbiont of Bathyaustriella thionipta]MCU7967517.1 CNP1-like family protein [gamma proteobacterium symbiont of Bathyaustriella thionipta]